VSRMTTTSSTMLPGNEITVVRFPGVCVYCVWEEDEV